ncbi:hypothetical protein HK104_007752 [Borealophlyctis nickersoniae]|nr:hypothetical protein HK104_007752 [Borealophlyctis nickersoniae]
MSSPQQPPQHKPQHAPTPLSHLTAELIEFLHPITPAIPTFTFPDRVPKPTAAFIQFCTDLIRRSGVQISEVLLALFYARALRMRVAKKPDGVEWGRERILMGALVVANKMLVDNVLPVRAWARLCNVPISDVIRTELAFSAAMNWELFVSGEVYTLWLKRLETLMRYGYVNDGMLGNLGSHGIPASTLPKTSSLPAWLTPLPSETQSPILEKHCPCQNCSPIFPPSYNKISHTFPPSYTTTNPHTVLHQHTLIPYNTEIPSPFPVNPTLSHTLNPFAQSYLAPPPTYTDVPPFPYRAAPPPTRRYTITSHAGLRIATDTGRAVERPKSAGWGGRFHPYGEPLVQGGVGVRVQVLI